jgi:cytochrome P450
MRTAKAIAVDGRRVPTSGESLPLLGDAPAMRSDALGLLLRAARVGDVVRLRVGRDVYLLNHPDHVQRVLHDNHANYRKSFFYARMRPLLGQGLLTSDGSAWRRRRRLAQPAFHKERLRGFVETMSQQTGAMLDRWEGAAERSEPRDVAAEMTRLTLAVAGRALFGADLLGQADEAGRALTTALRFIRRRFYAFIPLPVSVPTPRNLSFARAMRVLRRVVSEVIAARRGGPHRDDLLGMLMEARDAEDGKGLTDEELRDEVMTMVLAGHETTANALSWALRLLSLSPLVDRRLHEESSAVLGDRPATFESLPRLGLAERVHQEAMRLYPPAWAFGREAINPDAFGEFRIPAGAAVTMSPWLLHRDPRWWEDPEGFDPDRFAPERSAGRPKYAYIPFAAGPRMCIGYTFAMMEMQVVLAMTAARYRLDLLPGRPTELEPSVTLRPRGGIWMTVQRRATIHQVPWVANRPSPARP